MNNLKILPISDNEKSILQKRIEKYRGYCGIQINIKSFEKEKYIITVEQVNIINGFILTKSQLVERTKEFLKEYNLQLSIRPITYKAKFDFIDVVWIQNKMNEYHLKPSDMTNQLGINKSTISLILSGKQNFSKAMKSAFYYYFLVFELNKTFRYL